ncbi:SphA family protein [Alkalimarinus alittae]|uniref:Transporter n=1 Tax=Alkalimarinus alittae TaxID=2961619 RepID=A0ABY6N2V8_9ALTE|nr:transporter [Alkalimarinus alittae]UZE96360.1 transporter [Alkalimarinus alittae]
MINHTMNHCSPKFRSKVLQTCTSLVAMAALTSTSVSADEGGVAFWFSGQYSSFAAVPVATGWSMPIQGYYYNGGVSANKELKRGNQVSANLDSSLPLLMIQPTYAPETQVWGGQLALGLGFGWGYGDADANVTVSGFPNGLSRSDSVTGFTDLYPIASLAWADGNNNYMTYVTGDIPTGDYDPNRLANLGIGHAAIDGGGGYTYFNPATMQEFSAVVGLTYNYENDDTKYQNGIDAHLDWAASQFLNDNWQVGVAGYVYGQLSGDSSPTQYNDNIKSRIAAVGPEVGYSFVMNNQAAYLNLRAYWEFSAKHRVEGTAVFATASLPF